MADEAPDPATQRATLMATALKQKLPLAVLDPTCQWTDNKDQAAITALTNAGQVSNTRETGGAIFQNQQGQYCYSIPVSGNSPQAEHFQLRAQSTPEQKVVGVYHTHPGGGGDNAAQFSPDDVNVANQLKMQSYIQALKSGVVKRYDPATDKPRGADRPSAGQLVPPINTAS